MNAESTPAEVGITPSAATRDSTGAEHHSSGLVDFRLGVFTIGATVFLLFAAGAAFADFHSGLKASRGPQQTEYERLRCVGETAHRLTERGVSYRLVVPEGDDYLSQHLTAAIFPLVQLTQDAPGLINVSHATPESIGELCGDLLVFVSP